jgi:hypothetical protein
MNGDSLPTESLPQDSWIHKYLEKIRKETYVRVVYDLKLLSILIDDLEFRQLVAFIATLETSLPVAGSLDQRLFETSLCEYFQERVMNKN